MSVLMFDPRFREKIQDGRKLQTIRSKRKRPPKPGESLSLRQWAGASYRSRQLIIREAECKGSYEVVIDHGKVWIAGLVLNPKAHLDFANSDGFDSLDEFFRWFLPAPDAPEFQGHLIKWELKPLPKSKSRKELAYPLNWPEIAKEVKDGERWKCERCHHEHDVESRHVLTVHHLDGDKWNCEPWNLAALCQRCHLSVQNRVEMAQDFWEDVLPVSDWFRPHLEGYRKSLKRKASRLSRHQSGSRRRSSGRSLPSVQSS